MKTFSSEIQLTTDGSHTLFVPSLNEHYHSVNGAVTESLHIFIRAGLQQTKIFDLRLLEVGFGTGLNAFLTMLEAEKLNKHVYYTTLELYPLGKDKIEKFNYPDIICPARKADYFRLHTVPWGEECRITPYFTFCKLEKDFTSCQLDGQYDIVYFDAFAPDKQPEMWTQLSFDKLYEGMCNQGILTTYCAKGSVRRMLQNAGFKVERLSGPPGKREILRAIKIKV